MSRAARIKGFLQVPVARLRYLVSKYGFEQRYGVQTVGMVNSGHSPDQEAERVYYIAASWLTLRRALPVRLVSQQDVFIDLGCGMGRMILEAAIGYPFARVIGVDYSAPLIKIASENLRGTQSRQRCRKTELVLADVTEYEIPDDVTVVFLNNPFRGRIFESMIANLIASVDRQPRTVTVVYHNWVEEPALLATGRVAPIRRYTRQNLWGTTRVYRLR